MNFAKSGMNFGKWFSKGGAAVGKSAVNSTKKAINK